MRSFQLRKSILQFKGKNWYDLRYHSSIQTIKKFPPRAEIAWCHGAGGIALSRFRAYEITQNEYYNRELEVAIETLINDVESTVFINAIPSCLCHGIIGNLDILLTLKIEPPTDSMLSLKIQ